MGKFSVKTVLVMFVALFFLFAFGCQKEEERADVNEKTVETEEKVSIGFVGGIIHPFTSEVQRGLEETAKSLGMEILAQIPESWEPAVQTTKIDSLLAQGDMDLLVVIPTDKDALIPVLERVYNQGIPILTADTYIGDGVYEEGHPVEFPISYIGSDNVEGGRICGEALAEKIGYEGKVYIQNVKPGISTTDQRSLGFKQAIEKYPDIEIVGEDYNDADSAKATSQTSAVLDREPNLKGIFGTNTHGAAGAGIAVKNAGLGDEVEVIAFDADAVAVENLELGTIDMALAQKPYEMGLLSGLIGYAHLQGARDLPKQLPTGYVLITKENFKEPEYSKWIYK